MAWSKVKKGKYPIRWWYHKIMCEFFYWIGMDLEYFSHVTRCCDCGFNIYGEKIDKFK
jgi:hypothetical protein